MVYANNLYGRLQLIGESIVEPHTNTEVWSDRSGICNDRYLFYISLMAIVLFSRYGGRDISKLFIPQEDLGMYTKSW